MKQRVGIRRCLGVALIALTLSLGIAQPAPAQDPVTAATRLVFATADQSAEQIEETLRVALQAAGLIFVTVNCVSSFVPTPAWAINMVQCQIGVTTALYEMGFDYAFYTTDTADAIANEIADFVFALIGYISGQFPGDEVCNVVWESMGMPPNGCSGGFVQPGPSA